MDWYGWDDLPQAAKAYAARHHSAQNRDGVILSTKYDNVVDWYGQFMTAKKERRQPPADYTARHETRLTQHAVAEVRLRQMLEKNMHVMKRWYDWEGNNDSARQIVSVRLALSWLFDQTMKALDFVKRTLRCPPAAMSPREEEYNFQVPEYMREKWPVFWAEWIEEVELDKNIQNSIERLNIAVEWACTACLEWEDEVGERWHNGCDKQDVDERLTLESDILLSSFLQHPDYTDLVQHDLPQCKVVVNTAPLDFTVAETERFLARIPRGGPRLNLTPGVGCDEVTDLMAAVNRIERNGFNVLRNAVENPTWFTVTDNDTAEVMQTRLMMVALTNNVINTVTLAQNTRIELHMLASMRTELKKTAAESVKLTVGKFPDHVGMHPTVAQVEQILFQEYKKSIKDLTGASDAWLNQYFPTVAKLHSIGCTVDGALFDSEAVPLWFLRNYDDIRMRDAQVARDVGQQTAYGEMLQIPSIYSPPPETYTDRAAFLRARYDMMRYDIRRDAMRLGEAPSQGQRDRRLNELVEESDYRICRNFGIAGIDSLRIRYAILSEPKRGFMQWCYRLGFSSVGARSLYNYLAK